MRKCVEPHVHQNITVVTGSWCKVQDCAIKTQKQIPRQSFPFRKEEIRLRNLVPIIGLVPPKSNLMYRCTHLALLYSPILTLGYCSLTNYLYIGDQVDPKNPREGNNTSTSAMHDHQQHTKPLPPFYLLSAPKHNFHSTLWRTTCTTEWTQPQPTTIFCYSVLCDHHCVRTMLCLGLLCQL